MSSILGSFIAGQQAGQQQHKYRQEQSKLAQLREYTPMALAGDPSAQTQLAALDIDHSKKVQEQRDGQLRRFGGFIKFIDEEKASGDPRRLSAAMRRAAPYLQQLGVPAFDPDAPWTPEYDAGWAALKAQYEGAMAGGAGTQPSQFTALDLQAKAAGYQPGTQGYQDFFKRANGELARQSGAAIGYQKITGPDGREYLVATDPRGIGAQVVGDGTGYGSFSGQQPMAAAPPAAPQRADMEADIELANSMIAAGIPEAQVDAFLAQRGQRAPAVSAGPGAAAPAASGSVAGNPFASRRPEDQAAATERATQQVKLDFLPQQQAIETQGAIDRAVGIEQGKAGVEQAAAAPAAIETMQSSIKVIDELLDDPDLGTIVGWGSVNPLNYSPGSKARGLIARAEQISGKAFLAAFNQLKGAGAITEKEGEAATRAMARLDRSQSLEDYRTALADLRAAIAPGLARQRQVLARGQQPAGGQPQQPQQRPVMVNSPAEYNALPAGALYTAPDGSTRRKK